MFTGVPGSLYLVNCQTRDLFTIEEENNSYTAKMFSMNVLVEDNSYSFKSGKLMCKILTIKKPLL